MKTLNNCRSDNHVYLSMICLLSGIFAVMLLVCTGSTVSAQDPFDDVPAAPVAAPDPAPPVNPRAPKGVPLIDENTPLAVRAILEANPTTPLELIEAIDILARLRAYPAARELIKKLLAANPDDATLAAAVQKFDPDMWLRLSRDPEIPADYKALILRALQAAKKQSEDPARLQKLLDDYLTAQGDNALFEPFQGLLTAGEAGAAAAIHALARADLTAAQLDRIRLLLSRMERGAIQPLIGALATDNDAQRAVVLEMLAKIGGRTTAPWLMAWGVLDAPAAAKSRAAAQAALTALYGASPSRVAAAEVLKTAIQSWLNDEYRLQIDPAGNVDLWLWDSAEAKLVPQRLPQAAAQAARAARLAQDLLRIAPDDPQARELWLTANLRTAAYGAGLENAPAWTPAELQTITELGGDNLEAVLLTAVKSNDHPTAVAAIHALGQIGPSGTFAGPRPHPLVYALRSIDRRVQFAAAQIIVKLAPKLAFAGQGEFQAALAHLARSTGARRAIAAFPNAATATRLAGYLQSLGWQTDAATTGSEAFRLAQENPDCEVILLSNRIDNSPLSVALQAIRRDRRTARIPVVILIEDAAERPRISHLADNDPLTTIFVRPYDLDATKFAVEQAMFQAGGAVLSPVERRSHGDFALQAWLTLTDPLAATTPGYKRDLRPEVDLLAGFLELPERNAQAATLLGRIGNQTAQTALIDYASRPETPLPSRVAAVQALTSAIQAHGIQLTQLQLRAQYERYNTSAGESAETQQVLGSILDALELPLRAAK